MEVAQLGYLVAVIEERSFTRGATRVRVAQSAVSAAIGRLERELDVTLLDRGWRHVTPTAAGDVVYRHALGLLGSLQSIRDEIAAVTAGLSGSVSIGVVLTTGGLDLPAVVQEFQGAHPKVDVRIMAIPGPAETRLDPLREGTLDLALVPAAHPIPDSVHFTPVTRGSFVLVCPLGDALAHRRAVPLTDLGGRAFVDFPRTWGNRGIIDEHFAHHEVTRRVAVEVPDVATALTFVEKNAGLAFVPAEHAPPSGRQLAIVDLAEPLPETVLGIARSAIRPPTAAARQFYDALIATGARR